MTRTDDKYIRRPYTSHLVRSNTMENTNDNSTSNFSVSTVLSINNLTINLTTGLSTEFTIQHFYNDTTEPYTQSHPENISRQSWNLTRVGESLPKAATTVSSSLCTTTLSTTTKDPFDEFGPPEGVEYIFVPLGVMIFVIILSAVVIIISRKRKLERLRHRLMPLYNFDPGEEGEDDWETELLDEGFSSRQRRQGYQSMDSKENAELFSTAHIQNLG